VINPKLKAIEVVLSDGQTVTVHEPRVQDVGKYFRAMPALIELSNAMSSTKDAIKGVKGLPVDISDETLELIWPLFAVMSDITVDDYKLLPLWDGMAILMAFGEFVPKNRLAAQEAGSTS
jgi:hypothetical protein